jgi:hypothetical protein
MFDWATGSVLVVEPALYSPPASVQPPYGPGYFRETEGESLIVASGIFIAPASTERF